ncbi:biopolymertransporter ExbD/TolR [Candidatus Nitrosoglobus terrae]|uniref:Biopolymertransporter ExbD/TolR n=1 Tax=Candidatus Nitrosoglobus terrae TaxID=1630141 RepID=A0A1Q2SKK5_9GAMM|nr:biopolymer transporter ExbD [Candidatus Nitrosoglobus terrae]BAW79681.1 biopolymertransporter ExbD/TolR [Candidatus Nitrosoglobus terrae]
MRRRRHSQHQSGVSINLTPMIDMVFILLIFFIATTSFTKESGVEVNRPSAKTAVSKERSNTFIVVRANNEIWIDKRQVDIRTIRANVERIEAENPEGSVVIVADKDSKTGLVIEIMDQVRLAGVSDVSIAATPQQ